MWLNIRRDQGRVECEFEKFEYSLSLNSLIIGWFTIFKTNNTKLVLLNANFIIFYTCKTKTTDASVAFSQTLNYPSNTIV